jgi:5-methylcytosine-specific restriction protein A
VGGRHPDTAIPRLVKLRIWEREGGRCYLTGKKIMRGDAFDYEHVRSIRNGGENRESNIRLALRDKHQEKTAQERTDGAKADRIRAKHLGILPEVPHAAEIAAVPAGSPEAGDRPMTDTKALVERLIAAAPRPQQEGGAPPLRAPGPGSTSIRPTSTVEPTGYFEHEDGRFSDDAPAEHDGAGLELTAKASPEGDEGAGAPQSPPTVKGTG